MQPSTDPKPEAEAWTVGRLLNWTTDFFKQRGIESPRLEAEVLLAHCRNCQRIMLYTAFDELASDELRARFRQLVQERAAGKPVAYLVGKREFYSLDFVVTPEVLIPRPETELVVVALLDHAKQQGRHQQGLHVADVGTGSGVLAVCAAKFLPKSQVTALDLSSAALDVALTNAQQHGVEGQIQFVESDLFVSLPPEETFDFIVSNPPYITTAEMEQLPSQVRDYEPVLALAAGPNGTDVIERLLQDAPHRLRPGGVLLMEVSPMIAERVESLVKAAGLELLPTIKDLDGHQRVIQAAQRGAA